MRPNRSYPVVQEWLRCFCECRDRYPFLVIEGPSKLGKSQFVRQLTGRIEECCELNCISTPEPDVRLFKPHQHTIILFDEAPVKLVPAHKKLFQAPACWLELGAITTNCHSYRAWVHRTRMVICSNTWSLELARLLHEADRQWVLQNSRHLCVNEPMWVSETSDV